ncbi:MAG: ribbon-helix-helix protein, CopG family [Oscillospiraceae bacterium]|nr:ribbon-helix-helix protein, CopG family [Oscillospiraceae bacterium]
MTYKIQFGIRLDEETLTAIKKIAEDENRSLNNLIEYLIKQYIKEKKKKDSGNP